MKIENNIIVEATEMEMFSKWLDEDWCNVFEFQDYIERCIRNGTKILEEKDLTCNKDLTFHKDL